MVSKAWLFVWMPLAACSFLVDTTTLSGGAAGVDGGTSSDADGNLNSSADAQLSMDGRVRAADGAVVEVPATDATVTDATVTDATVIDVTVTDATVTDAIATSDAATPLPSPCTGTNPKRLFCDDFDTGGEILSTRWDAANLQGFPSLIWHAIAPRRVQCASIWSQTRPTVGR